MMNSQHASEPMTSLAGMDDMMPLEVDDEDPRPYRGSKKEQPDIRANQPRMNRKERRYQEKLERKHAKKTYVIK